MFRRLLPILIVGLIAFDARGSAVDESKASSALKWPNQAIKIFLSPSLFSPSGTIKADSDVKNAVLRALQRWEEAAHIEFQVAFSDVDSISPKGRAGDGVSIITIATDPENLLAFSGKGENASGLTRVFYDKRGSITEADIALNPAQLYTTDKTPGTFDLEAVLTHEVGHLLGLSHSPDASSVMFDGVPRNGAFESLNLARQLSADDRSKIRKAYPPLQFLDGCCVRAKARLGAPGEPNSNYLMWIQDSISGALTESTVLKPNSIYEFGPLARGNYEVIAQSHSSNLLSGTSHSGARDVRSQQNISVVGPFKPVTFDILYIGLHGQLSKRAVSVFGGNNYRLVLAGVGLSERELRFSTTSKDIALESVRSESWTASDGLAHRAFQLTVSRYAVAGQYSIFAEDQGGNRRYLVGAISVN